MRDSMENTVIETTIEAKKKTEIEDIMRTEIEIMEEAVHIGMEAARGNEVLARRLLAIGGLPQAYPWLQSTRGIWQRQEEDTSPPASGKCIRDP